MTSSPYENNIKSVQNEISIESTTSDVSFHLNYSALSQPLNTQMAMSLLKHLNQNAQTNVETFEAQFNKFFAKIQRL